MRRTRSLDGRRDPHGGSVAMRLSGRVQSGKGDAARWLSRFNTAYAQKTGRPVFPGSLNVALGAPFDWFAPSIEERTVWFGREEYGGERDILLLPCVLTNLNTERAMLCTPTTTARNRPDPWVVEIIAAVNLRATWVHPPAGRSSRACCAPHEFAFLRALPSQPHPCIRENSQIGSILWIGVRHGKS